MTFTLSNACLRKRKRKRGDNLRFNYCARVHGHKGRCASAVRVDGEWIIVHRHGK